MDIITQINLLCALLFGCGIGIGLLIGTINKTAKYFLKCSCKNRVLRVIYSSINCETTADFCKDCGKQLTIANPDCR